MSLDQNVETQGYYGNWGYVIVSVLLFGFFIAFMPLHKKTHRRPASIYIAFIVASAFEMYGIPLSMYFVAWAFGVYLPEGLLWGHTLKQYIGYWGIYLGLAINLVGADLVIRGWGAVHKDYWGKEKGKRKLVTDGVYAYMRHPQYTGFMLLTLGLIVHWATLPLLIMWPILAFQRQGPFRHDLKHRVVVQFENPFVPGGTEQEPCQKLAAEELSPPQFVAR